MKYFVVIALALVGQSLSSPVINIQINAGGAGEMEGMTGNGEGSMGGGGGMGGHMDGEGSMGGNMDGEGGMGGNRGGMGGQRGGNDHMSDPMVEDHMWMIAVGDDYAALEYKDESGYLQGFHFDLIDAVCEAANISCSTVHEPSSHCINPDYFGGEGLVAHWYDACAGWDKTVRRNEMFKFSHPYIFDTESYFYRKIGKGAAELSTLPTAVTGFVSGISSDPDCVSRNYDMDGVPIPDDHMKGLDTHEDLHDALVNDEIHFAYMNSIQGDRFDDIEKVGDGYICTLTGASMMSRKDSKFTAEWNRGYEMIRDNGKLKEVCQKAMDVHATDGRDFPGCADAAMK